MELCVLGSGSSGNCSAVRVGERLILIDAGFGPRTVAKRLGTIGARLDEVDALLLTHLDRDHFNPSWFGVLAQRGVRLYCHERHVAALYRREPTTAAGVDARTLHRAGLLYHFDGRPFELDLGDGRPRPRVQGVPLAHDETGTVGFVMNAGGLRLGFATDLGRVPEALVDAFEGVDLLAIESNYDPQMQMNSSRPAALKRRIMGGRGHLSNEQALEAVRSIARRTGRVPNQVVLLHLSRECNDPDLARRVFSADAALARRLCISGQTEPTGWVAARGAHVVVRGEQMMMFR